MITVDARLHLDLSAADHWQMRQDRRRAFETLLTDTEWHNVVSPLAAEILGPLGLLSADVGAADASDFKGNQQLQYGWEFARQRIRGDHPNGSDEVEDMAQVVLERTAQVLVETTKSDSAAWLRVLKNAKPYELVVAFVDAIPQKMLQDQTDAIIQATHALDPLAMVELREGTPETYDGIFKDIVRRTEAAGDLWQQAMRLDRFADQAMLELYPRYLVRLVSNGGVDSFLAWFGSLHPFVAACSVNEIEDMTFVEDAVDRAVGTKADLRLLALIVQRAIHLWECIEQSLEQAAKNGGYGNNAAEIRARYSEKFRDWKETEIKKRVERVAQALVSYDDGVLAVLCLRHIFTRRWSADRTPPQASGLFRDSLAAILGRKRNLPELGSEILAVGATSPALVSAAWLPFTKDTETSVEEIAAAGIVLGGYREWLSSDESHWSQPLTDDDFVLAWRLAGNLALQADPANRWSQLFKDTRIVMEGWKVSFDDSFRAVPARAHLFVVGAMAAEWLVAWKRGDDAKKLLGLVWLNLHEWLRMLPSNTAIDATSTAVTHVWARSVLVFGDQAEPLAVAAIAMIDRIEWLVHGVVACKQNRRHGDISLNFPNAVRKAFRTRIDMMLPVWQREPARGRDYGKAITDMALGILEDDPQSSGH